MALEDRTLDYVDFGHQERRVVFLGRTCFQACLDSDINISQSEIFKSVSYRSVNLACAPSFFIVLKMFSFFLILMLEFDIEDFTMRTLSNVILYAMFLS